MTLAIEAFAPARFPVVECEELWLAALSLNIIVWIFASSDSMDFFLALNFCFFTLILEEGPLSGFISDESFANSSRMMRRRASHVALVTEE